MPPSNESHEERRVTGPRETGSDAADQLASHVRAFVDARPAPDLTAGVLRAIGRQRVRPEPGVDSVGRRLALLLWAPRSVVIRPVYGVLGTAAVLLAVLASVPPTMPVPPPAPTQPIPQAQPVLYQPPPAPVAPRVFVQFRLPRQNASNVTLTGSFTGWQRTHELRQASPGVWTVTIPLEPGVHDYLFVVDGHDWVPDPYAPRVPDGFGGVNSRLALAVPENRAS